MKKTDKSDAENATWKYVPYRPPPRVPWQ